MYNDKKIIINIGRQLGSGGREIGKKLSEIYKAGYYDKELITLAAKSSGLCEDFFKKADEKASQGLSAMFSMRVPFITEGSIAGVNYLSNDSLFKIQSDVIRDLAAQGSCVFVGRCSDYILRDRTDVLNTFFHADNEFRADRIVKLYGETLDKPAKRLKEKDDKRRTYYRHYTGRVWGAASNYDVTLDSGRIGVEHCADIVVGIAAELNK